MADISNYISSPSRSLPYIEAGEAGLDASRSLTLEPRILAARGHMAQVDHAEARRQLIDAGRQFEAYFISYLLKVMRETVPQGSIGSKQGAYFHSFYDQEIGTRAAESGGIGIATMVQEYAKHSFPLSSGNSQVSVVENR